MKTRLSQYTLVIILIVIFATEFSCKKDDPNNSLVPPSVDDTLPPDPNDTSYTLIADSMPYVTPGADTIEPIDTIPPPPVYDTVFPLRYFPAWPGSYWNYIDTMADSGAVTLHAYVHPEYFLDVKYLGGLDYHYVPLYVGAPDSNQYAYYQMFGGMPIWEYEAHTGHISHSGSWQLTRILSETNIGPWEIHYWGGTGISRRVIGLDLAIEIDGYVYEPTISIEEYYSYGPPTEIRRSVRYYTQDIGLIKYEHYNFGELKKVWQIIDYHINN